MVSVAFFLVTVVSTSLLLLVAGEPIAVTLCHKGSDCVPSLAELPEAVGDSEHVTVHVQEGEYRVPPGLLLHNLWISFQAQVPGERVVFVFYLNETGSLQFDYPYGNILFDGIEFTDDSGSRFLPLTILQTKGQALHLNSCKFLFHETNITIDTWSTSIYLGGAGSSVGGGASPKGFLSITMHQAKAVASLVNVFMPRGLQLSLPENGQLKLIGNEIGGDVILQSPEAFAWTLLVYNNFWKDGGLSIPSSASGSLIFRGNWVTLPPFKNLNWPKWQSLNIQGNNLLFREPLWTGASLSMFTYMQFGHNFWLDPQHQLSSITPHREEILASRLGAPIKQRIEPNGLPEVGFTDFSSVFRNGTFSSSHVVGLAIYGEGTVIYSRPYPPVMLQQMACAVPHEIFFAETPTYAPTMNVSYDLSAREDCKKLLESATKPTLWYLPLDTNSGDPLGEWQGVPHQTLNWNAETSQLNFTLNGDTDPAVFLRTSAMKNGLPLALFLPPLLGFAQPTFATNLSLESPTPFVINVPLTLFPSVGPSTNDLRLKLNITVVGATIGQEITILSGEEVHLQGNQANITIALLASVVNRAKIGSKLVMTLSIADWKDELQLLPLSKEHTTCLVTIDTNSPSIDPKDAPTASVFPDNTPHVQLVPKKHEAVHISQRVGFHFHSITERDKNGEVVRTFTFPKTSGYNASYPDNNTAEFHVALGEEKQVEVHWNFNVVEQDTWFTFGSENFTVLAGYNKWSLSILGWPMTQQSQIMAREDGEPSLPLEVKVNVTSWDGPLNFTDLALPPTLNLKEESNGESDDESDGGETNRNSTTFTTKNTRLMVGLLHISLVDGEEREGYARFEPMTGEDEGGVWLFIHLPLGKLVEYDPDVQVLVDTTKDDDGHVNLKMVIIVAASVGVAVCVVASTIVGVVVWQRRKNARFRAAFGAVNFTEEDSYSSTAEYSMLVDSSDT
ncbi:hypothetical protein QOT17_003151 [Balamuthia mandrillaris]